MRPYLPALAALALALVGGDWGAYPVAVQLAAAAVAVVAGLLAAVPAVLLFLVPTHALAPTAALLCAGSRKAR